MKITKEEIDSIKHVIEAAALAAEMHAQEGNEPIWAHIEDAQEAYIKLKKANG